MTQPNLSLSSSPPSVQPAVTVQAQLQGLTTTSPLLATTANLPTQTITSHVQQVPVSVFDWNCVATCTILILSLYCGILRHFICLTCLFVFSGVASVPVHQSRVCAAGYIEAWPLHGYYCSLPHILGHDHKSSTEHFTAGGNTRL